MLFSSICKVLGKCIHLQNKDEVGFPLLSEGIALQDFQNIETSKFRYTKRISKL